MMNNKKHFLQRTEGLIGSDNLEKLSESKLALFGLGGVGSFVFEALVRMGIGEFLLVDYDKIDETNINRQILATYTSIGSYKTDLAKERGLDISPDCKIKVSKSKVTEENIAIFNLDEYDYVVDSIDDTMAKLALIKYCKGRDIEIISAMGGGNKLDPKAFKVADIYETKICPLAKSMRKKLREQGITDLKVVYSEEKARPINGNFIGTVSYVPSSMGLIIASEVVKDLLN